MNLNILKKRSSEYFLLKQIVKRNFSSKYKDSVLGILWSFLNPLITMIALNLIFSTMFNKSIPNYPVFFICGRCMFDYFKAGTKVAMNSLKSNKSILNKIYVPRHIFAIGGITSEFINYLITLIILVMAMIVTSAPFRLIDIAIIIPIGILTILIIGAGLILAIGASYFTDIKYLYDVFVMVLMYGSAIFYPVDIVPIGIRKILELNPVYQCIAQMRQIIIQGTFPPLSSFLYTFIFAIVVFVLGILIFRKYKKKIIREL